MAAHPLWTWVVEDLVTKSLLVRKAAASQNLFKESQIIHHDNLIVGYHLHNYPRTPLAVSIRGLTGVQV
jgi:hypothetical protein